MFERKNNLLIMQERRAKARVKKTLKVVQCSSQYLFERNYLSRDISEDGICLLSPHRIEIGEEIKIGISFPECEQPVVAVGKVMRRNETNDRNFPFILGIQFTKVSKKAYHQIRNHMRYFALKDEE